MSVTSGTLTPEQWHDAMGATFNGLAPSPARLPVDHTPVAQQPSGHVRAVALDDVDVYGIAGCEQILTRSPRAARQRASDLLKVCLMVQGSATVEQSGRAVTVGPGEFALYDTEQPYRLVHRGQWQVRVMTVHRDDLHLPDKQVRRLLERPHGAGFGPGRLYSSFLDSLVDGDVAYADAPAGPAYTAGRHLRDAGVALLRAALTQDLDPALESGADAVAEQLIAAIVDHLADPGLSIESVARSQGLSTRTVQRLLAGQGLTFTSLVRARRLEGIRRDLADPRLGHLSIGSVAARWGVHDQTWVSRSFRKAYGASPTEYRQEHAPAVG